MYADGESARNFPKMSMLELKDTLARQEALIKNKSLLNNLKDKGASVITARDRIRKEIDSRLEIEKIESRLGSIDLDPSNQSNVLKAKHVQYVCAKEKPSVNAKYRPYQSLTNSRTNARPTTAKERATMASVEMTDAASHKMTAGENLTAARSAKTTAAKSVDVTAACEPKMVHEPAIVIPLGESLVIQDEQSSKSKAEHLRRFMKFREPNDSSSGSEDGGSRSDQSEEES